uniref:Uncharacterized protein n=1 Tax=Trichogramma kaykai TaxID=54128 RepID=A0ABD2WVK0_9HYME
MSERQDNLEHTPVSSKPKLVTAANASLALSMKHSDSNAAATGDHHHHITAAAAEIIELDADALEVLGVDPSKPQPAKNSLREELIVRWKNLIVNGLDPKLSDSFLEKYEPVPELKAQRLNEEFLCSLSETHRKRDSYFVNTQNTAASALSAIGIVISSLLSDTSIINRKSMLETLYDAGRIVSQLHFNQLCGRKACIFSLVKKNLRHVFENLKSDSYLFGKDLTLEIKKSMGDAKNFLFIKESDFSQQKFNNKKFNSFRPSVKRNTNSKESKPFRKFPNAKNKFSKTPQAPYRQQQRR